MLIPKSQPLSIMAFETKRSGPCEPPSSRSVTDRKAGVSCTLSTILSHTERLALGEPETDVVPVRTTLSSSLLHKYLTTLLIFFAGSVLGVFW